jgi:hypothetical protein
MVSVEVSNIIFNSSHNELLFRCGYFNAASRVYVMGIRITGKTSTTARAMATLNFEQELTHFEDHYLSCDLALTASGR